MIALGARPIIYTSYNAWTTLVIPKNPPRPPGVPLWNAWWDGDPDFDFPSRPFGAWLPAEVIGEQWSGGTTVCGTFVDRNEFVDGLVLPPSAGEPLPPSPAPCGPIALRAAILEKGMKALVNGDGRTLYDLAVLMGTSGPA